MLKPASAGFFICSNPALLAVFGMFFVFRKTVNNLI